MKYELFVLLAVLLASPVATPERMISSCNTRTIVRKGYVPAGRTIGGNRLRSLCPVSRRPISLNCWKIS